MDYEGCQAREEASEMVRSTRYGREDTQNVTQRDSKRPKERLRDKAYKARFSMGSSAGINRSPPTPVYFPPPLGGHSWPKEDGLVPSAPTVSAVFSHAQFHGSPSRGSQRGAYSQAPPDDPFEIMLIFEGNSVTHRVWSTMTVHQLTTEAGSIFGLDPSEIVLLLFSTVPITLQRDATISGPPRVLHGARVMVFHIPGSAFARVVPERRQGHQYAMEDAPVPPPQPFNSKLLSTFKLPKCDGVAKSWKAWEKSFQRFLGFHQLDHVLEEDFPSVLWVTPGARAANKMVFVWKNKIYIFGPI